MAERRGFLVVLGAVAAAYATAFGASFHFDDAHNVVGNPDVQSWSAWLGSLPAIRAATKASFVASHALSAAPWGYVLGSVLLHAASALAVLALVRRWAADFGANAAQAALAALAGALVFALHPAQTEAVTYVSGRSVVLAGCCYLAALLAYERARTSPYTNAWMGTSLAAFATALAARETAWTLPFALVLLEAARGAAWRTALRRAMPHFAVLAAALVAIALSPTYARLLRESFATRGPLANLAAQVDGVAYLVTHPLLTLRVNFDPDVTVSPDAHGGLAALAIVAAIALGCACLRRVPWLGFGILWFFLHLVPTNGPVARYDLVNDRQLYLALLGPALVAGIILSRTASRGVRSAMPAALCAVLGAATFVRNADYGSEVALWEATVRASPRKSRPWNNLGWAWQQRGERERAHAAYARALELDPHNFRARANLLSLERGTPPP